MRLKIPVTHAILYSMLALTLAACGDDPTDEACGGVGLSTELIRGPAVGESGNNADNPFRALAVHPSDPDTLYVGSEGNGLFKSSDGGTTWTWLRSGLKHCGSAYPEIYSISIDSGDPDRIYLAANAGPGPVDSGHSATAGVYRSTDAGATWTQLSSGLPTGDVNSVLVMTGSHVLAGLGAGESTNGDSTFYPGGIYYAGFSATSWNAASTPANTSTSIFFQMVLRGTTIFAFGGLPTTGSSSTVGVIKSTDGGVTWSAVANPLANTYGAHIDAASDGQTLYASLRSDATAPYFYKSTDGGANWTNPASITSVASGPVRIVGADPNVALAAGQEVLYRTTNGFTNVSTVLTAASGANTIVAIETAPSDSNTVYVTTKGLLVYKSTDAGASFGLVANLRTFLDSQP